ncbi:MAG: tRNA pseudouridine(55) synthase TruB [Tissierellia bacterium]|nr:tRNA pseudouridine(55) synthase TruB [Tissierellia bacterium]
MDGIINIFKPKGITSHDVIKELRKHLNIKKIGHTGTLDPNATGVLPVCLGKGTRISEYLLNVEKEYIAELTLGLATDTQDSEGKILNYSNKEVSIQDIYRAFDNFKGEIEQIPPMYSAIKVKGKKLYELARKGETIERKPRKVHIYDLQIKNIHENKIVFYVKCSKGTYVRTLCDDIGKLLGTYGYMSYLIRVGVGEFKICDSISLDYLKGLDREEIGSFMYPLDKSLNHLSSITVDERYYKQLINGNIIVVKDFDNLESKLDQLLKVYCKDIFIGIGLLIKRNNIINLKMDKVLI